VRRRLAELRADLKDAAKWIRDDPKVTELQPGGGEFRTERLFTTSVGHIVVGGSGAFRHIVRFGEDGWVRRDAMTFRPGVEALAAAIEAVGLPEDEAKGIAAEMEAFIAAHWVPPQPPVDSRWKAIKLAVVYVVPWGLGVGSALLGARRLLRSGPQR
jgi:hypothetical protein